MLTNNSAFPNSLTDWSKQFGIALLYFIFDYLVIGNFTNNYVVSIFWPGSGLALAVLLIGGKKYLLGLFLGSLALGFVSNLSFLAVSAITLGRMLEVLLAVWLVTRDGKFLSVPNSLPAYLRLIVLGGAVASVAGAFITIGCLLLGGVIAEPDYIPLSLSWWMGDTLGVVLITPLILVWWREKIEWPKSNNRLEGMLLVTITLVVGQVTFVGWFHESVKILSSEYLPFLLIAWVAMRLDLRAVSLLLLVIALQGGWGALHGVGYFAGDTATTGFRDYWQYVLILSIVGTALASYVQELKQKEQLLVAEIENRTNTEQAIRHVARAVSFETGEGFFQRLMAELAYVFGADYAFVGVRDRLQPQTINTLSVYAHGKHVDNMSYSLEDTPCANVVGKQTCVYPEKVCELFPEDKLLMDMGAESYIASPMFDAAGHPLGLIAVLDGKPMKDTAMVVDMLEIFAARASAELQRLRDEQQLRIAAATFELQEGVLITDAENLILRTNRAFSNITGYSAEEIIGKNPRIFSSGNQSEEFYEAMWERINNTGSWEGEVWNRRKNGEVYPEHLSITAVKDANGILMNYVGTHTDITLRKAAEEEIRNLAFYDPLTRLPNRRLLQDRLGRALVSSARRQTSGALLFVDLDNFKALNDTLGHDVGDILLLQVAHRLQSCLREGDTVARLGGDEFVVILEGLSESTIEAAAQIEHIGKKMLAIFQTPYFLAEHEYHCTTSIGVTLFGSDHQSTDMLLKQADIAMYQAKKAGRNTLRFFDQQMQASISERVAMESELRKAIESRSFCLYYQIQVDSLNRPVGAEALIRWLHPELGMISPLKFIPLAEETGMIFPIGKWVLETACAQIKLWQKDALTLDLTLAVNVSAKQFRQGDFVAQVRDVIQRHAINPVLLKLELTESLLLENVEDTVATMKALHEIGVRLSLDDFGTGYSSLQYLKQLPLDQLKIDQSFVRDIVVDSSDRAIVHTIIAMAKSLDLEVIAEGVEMEEQRQLLLKSGCANFQGYLFGKPVAIEQFDTALKSR